MTRERGRWLRAAVWASVFVAASACARAARSQTLSPEFTLEGGSESADLWTATNTRVAFDGEQYVVVWSDARRAPDGLLASPALLAARISETGELLDAHGVVVATEGVSTGQSAELRRAPWGSAWLDNSGRVLRLDHEARVIGEPLTIPLGTQNHTISCAEADCLVTGVGWFELDEPEGDVVSARRTRAAILNACGDLVAAELDVPPGHWSSEYGGQVHLLVGVEEASVDTAGRGPRASAVSRDGKLLWGPAALGSPEPNAASFDRFVVAYGRERFLVLWATRSEERWQLWATTVALSGPSGDARVVLETSSELVLGGLVWEGAEFRLAYVQGGELRSLSFDEAGGARGQDVRLPVPEGCVPAEARLTAGGPNSLITWSQGVSAPCPGGSALVVPHAEGKPTLVAFLHSRAPVDAAAFASSGAGYLAAWFEPRREAPGVYVQRLALDGSPDAEPPALAIPVAADSKPVVSNRFVEGRYRVATADRVVLVDPETRAISKGESPVCDSATSSYLELDTLAGEAAEDVPTTQRLVARRTSRDACGVALSSEQTWLHQSPDFSVDDSVVSAFDGERYAVVWEHWGGHTLASGVYFMSFDREARPLLDAPRLLEEATGQPSALVWNSGAHLLITDAYTEAGDPNGIAARRLSSDGDWLDPRALALADLQLGARIAEIVAVPDRDGWLLAWEQSQGTSADVAAARLDREGGMAWRGLVANSPEPEQLPAAVPSGGQSALVAYGRFEPGSEVVANLVAYRVLAAEGCGPLEGCAPDACDACCAGGCKPLPGPAECDAPRCGSECNVGERCVEGLGCLPDVAVAASTRTSRGCGCRHAAGSTSGLFAPYLMLVGLGYWRRQRSARRRARAVVYGAGR